MNGDVDFAQLTRELEEMKAKGLRGAEIWDIGVIRPNPDEPVPAGPPFMGPEWLKTFNHVIDEASRLGLEMGMDVSSSWNVGGSWVKPSEAMKGLYHGETAVAGPARFSEVLPLPGNHAPKGPNGTPLYYKDVAVLAFPKSKDNSIGDVKAVVDLSGKMNADGRLTWDVPRGDWVIQRFVCTNTGQKLCVPSPNSNGLLIDHCDARAAENYCSYVIETILKTRKSFDSLKFMEMDSIEVHEGHDWTESFMAEFRRRRGYDPTAYLPVLKGKSFADPQIAARFLHDYRMTVSDLWIEGHFGKSKEVLNKHGLKLIAETGHGGYPRTEALRAGSAVDVPRGEFWNGAQFWVTKEAASGAHVYGQKFVDAESLTGWRHWQDGPLEYKRLVDTAFCDGLNCITFHTFAHNPPAAGLPGRVYHAGEHLNVNSTWWPKAAPLFSYLSRCCYMLQQGLPVADVCYYYGDGAPSLVATRRIGPRPERLDGDTCAHCGRPNPAPVQGLGAGYDYDVIDSGAILTRLEVKDGRLVLPDGVSYALLALPDRQDMPLAVLQKLEKLVRDGATILGPRPVRSPSLTDYPRCDGQVQAIADRLWGSCDGNQIRERSCGNGRIIWDRNRTREILQQRGIGPDFTFTSADKDVDLDYIHRRTPSADIFFVSNKLLHEAEAQCVFRVAGRRPQLWFADTGEVQACAAYDVGAESTKLTLRLPPAGSVFVVFEGKPEEDRWVSLRRLGDKNGPAEGLLGDPGTSDGMAWLTGSKLQGGELRVGQPGAYLLQDARGTTAKVEVANVPAPLEIAGPWEVRFPQGRGAPPSKTFEKLVSWTSDSLDGVKYFSGTATYLKEFEAPENVLADGRRWMLDLGQVRNVADVTLNGKHLGILWKPPFRLDVTGIVHAGKNQLSVEVTNLWANRLAGDALLPKEKRITRVSQKLPLGPSLESGLLGPVQLRVLAPVRVLPAPRATSSDAAAPALDAEASRRERIKWWREARFGMFIHWGLYSIPAGVWKNKIHATGYSEWIMFDEKIPAKEYELLAGRFNPVKFDAKAWVAIAKKAGMKYMVLTAKHHDGFSMFKSRLTGYNIVDATPLKRDVARELADACRKAGIRFGCYYSVDRDWYRPTGPGNRYKQTNVWDFPASKKEDFDRYYTEFAKPQVEELLVNYRPDILWFDGIDMMSDAQVEDLEQTIRKLQPDCIVNSRIKDCGFPDRIPPRYGDYISSGDNEIMDKGRGCEWENPGTMNTSYGYNQNDHNWVEPREIVFRLVDIVSKGGNYLLNVGPTSEGIIPQPSIDNLKAVGEWMETNQTAIYGTSPWKVYGEGPMIRFTAKGSSVFAICLAWPDTEVLVRALGKKEMPGREITAVNMLGSKDVIKWRQTSAGLAVSVPQEKPCRYAFVYRIDLR